MPPFIHHRRVQFAETDMAGIVHFANFYRWMEEAEHEFLRTHGMKIMDLQGDGSYIGWPRVSCSCHYEAPARYDDVLEVQLRIERVGLKSVTYYVEFFRAGKRLAYGRTKAACCFCFPDGTLRSIEIPQRYRQVLVEDPQPDSPAGR